jgi:integrase
VAGVQGRARSGRANLKCGSSVSKARRTARRTAASGAACESRSSGKGPEDSRPRRYRESTRLDDNRANRRLWSAKLKEIESEIVAHSFDPIRWFPWSRRADPSRAKVETIGDFVRQYLQELAGLRERTREEYRFIFEAHVLASKFALVPLAELDDGHIKRLIRELELKQIPGGRQLQASTINKILARIRTMVSVAFDRGLIPRERGNPVLLVKNLKKPPRRVEPFTPDELLRIFAATEGQQRTFYITLAFTGLRPSEALALCWDLHLDFERELILTRQQLVDGKVSENLKTERSLRDVRMFRSVKIALASLALQNRLRSEFVFCNRFGKPLTEAWQGDAPWRQTVASAGVPYRVLYNLRHSYTTLMLMAGQPIQWIAHQLGHVGVKKIDEVYGRWSNTREEEKLDLERFFAAVIALPRAAQSRPNLPKFCPSEKAKLSDEMENPEFTGTYGSHGAPAGNRTRTLIVREPKRRKANAA